MQQLENDQLTDLSDGKAMKNYNNNINNKKMHCRRTKVMAEEQEISETLAGKRWALMGSV